MKKTIIILFILLLQLTLIFADYRITRGPDIGEIYFIGPTVTEPAAIYHSIDFGETSTCMDSVNEVESICADLTLGSLYKVRMPDCLYYSDNYGQEESWIFRTAEGSYKIFSGRNEGEIFKGVSMGSNDYGQNFNNNQCLGLFGFPIIPEIDSQESIAYTIVSQYGIPDTLWLLITYDNFETLEIQNVYNRDEFPIIDLSRGTESGELYFVTSSPQTIFHSTDYGLNGQYINEFNLGLDYTDLVGGRQAGEVYVLVTYNALMHTIEHTYIFHSIDYGRTFTVYHSFSKGEEPLVANFSSSLTEGEAPFTVQFSNYSVGEIISYEWDFDNDGIIDSNELEPEFTYLDTGYYSVKLIIHDQDDTDEFLREDFIHVTDGSGADNYELEIRNYKLNNYPNPFNPNTTISFEFSNEQNQQNEQLQIEIYNVKGQKVDELAINHQQTAVSWNAESMPSGIYLYRLSIKDSPINKMLLLK
ncbi:MAG: PKD domain-containing protein [Candidatus Cloacimonetes bacterium]|nr:PKD domain-containing protein [Candidatus Cloacimonadota bacterium]